MAPPGQPKANWALHEEESSRPQEMSSFSAPGLLLELLSLLPDSSRAKQDARKKLPTLLTVAARDKALAFSAAGLLFHELARQPGSPSSQQRAAEYLCASPAACRLLVDSVNFALQSTEGRAGGQQQQLPLLLPGPGPDALLAAESSLAEQMWEVVGRQYGSAPAQYSSASAPPLPRVALQALQAATLLSDQVATLSKHGAQHVAGVICRQGALLLGLMQGLKEQARAGELGRAGSEELSRLEHCWALHAGLSLRQRRRGASAQVVGTCQGLIAGYCRGVLEELVQEGRVQSSWFQTGGPFHGLACTCHNIAKVLEQPSSDEALAAAKSLFVGQGPALLQLLVRCLGFAIDKGAGAADAMRAAPALQGAAAAAAAGVGGWQGLPADPQAAGMALLELLRSGLELLGAAAPMQLWRGMPAQVLSELQCAMHAVTAGAVGHEARSSWLPLSVQQELRTACRSALLQLGPRVEQYQRYQGYPQYQQLQKLKPPRQDPSRQLQAAVHEPTTPRPVAEPLATTKDHGGTPKATPTVDLSPDDAPIFSSPTSPETLWAQAAAAAAAQAGPSARPSALARLRSNSVGSQGAPSMSGGGLLRRGLSGASQGLSQQRQQHQQQHRQQQSLPPATAPRAVPRSQQRREELPGAGPSAGHGSAQGGPSWAGRQPGTGAAWRRDSNSSDSGSSTSEEGAAVVPLPTKPWLPARSPCRPARRKNTTSTGHGGRPWGAEPPGEAFLTAAEAAQFAASNMAFLDTGPLLRVTPGGAPMQEIELQECQPPEEHQGLQELQCSKSCFGGFASAMSAVVGCVNPTRRHRRYKAL